MDARCVLCDQTLTTVATMVGAQTYRWRRNGIQLANGAHYSGATTNTLNITNATAAEGGTYDVQTGATSKHRWAYGCSKQLEEFLALAHWRETRLPVVIARLFNTVGPRQTGQYGMVVPRFVGQGQQPLVSDCRNHFDGLVDLTRRRGTTELQLGFEYERVNVGEGVWINKGDNIATGDEIDYVLSPEHSHHQLGWFTVEFTFLNHAEINKVISVRYGGGIGLGIVTGELDHYNIICAPGATNANPEPGCIPPRFNGPGMYSENNVETQVSYSLPPVFPVVNAILGLQIKPTDKLTINIEGGIRTLPFAGVSSSYFF
jgi:hypothetical protein